MLCLSKEIWWKNAQECYQHLSIEVLSQRLSPKLDDFSPDFSNLLIFNANTLNIDMNDEWQENQEKHPNKKIWSKTKCNPKGNKNLSCLVPCSYTIIILPLWRIKWRLLSVKKIAETIITKSGSRFYTLLQTSDTFFRNH